MTKKDLAKRLQKLENRLDPPERLRIVWGCGDFVEIDGVTMSRDEYERQRDPTTRVIKLSWD